MARKVSKSDEELRQEGREEVLEWLRGRKIVNYSTRDGQYFIWNRFTETLLILPFQPSEN